MRFSMKYEILTSNERRLPLVGNPRGKL